MAEQKEIPQEVKKGIKVARENIAEQTLSRIKELQETGLQLPKNYIPDNAVRRAVLSLNNMKDKEGKPVLESCTSESICNSILDMVTQGLNPVKGQCAFVAYGGQLTMQREYFGTLILAKRHGNVKEINANVIYQGDEFIQNVDLETGRKKLVKHETLLENIDLSKIKGAYAVVIFNDGTTDLEVMTISQIRAAWEMGAAKGNSKAHQNFTDQMCKKTVINRAAKVRINASDDESYLMDSGSDNIAVETEFEEIKEQEKPVITIPVEVVETKKAPF